MLVIVQCVLLALIVLVVVYKDYPVPLVSTVQLVKLILNHALVDPMVTGLILSLLLSAPHVMVAPIVIVKVSQLPVVNATQASIVWCLHAAHNLA